MFDLVQPCYNSKCYQKNRIYMIRVEIETKSSMRGSVSFQRINENFFNFSLFAYPSGFRGLTHSAGMGGDAKRWDCTWSAVTLSSWFINVSKPVMHAVDVNTVITDVNTIFIIRFSKPFIHLKFKKLYRSRYELHWICRAAIYIVKKKTSTTKQNQ